MSVSVRVYVSARVYVCVHVHACACVYVFGRAATANSIIIMHITLAKMIVSTVILIIIGSQ